MNLRHESGYPVFTSIEEPKFVITQQLNGAEVREYAPYIVAEVVVPGPADEASTQGFKLLAGYIFGKNKGDRKVAMTAPVTQTPVAPTPASQKIEMTAPVTQSATSSGYAVQFVMPAQFTLETLPEPIDPQVHLKAVPSTRYGVIKYSGLWSQSNYDTHLATLRSTLAAAQLKTTGDPVLSRYNPPWTPWFMRRNEIWLKLD
ncbi:MAG: heme-binding protein [Ramlibacter sp.]|nr:heme-binding protein [Ramlibacter sp.]